MKLSFCVAAVLSVASAFGFHALGGEPGAAQNGKPIPSSVLTDPPKPVIPQDGRITIDPKVIQLHDPIKNPKSLDEFFAALPNWNSTGNSSTGKPNPKKNDSDKTLYKQPFGKGTVANRSYDIIKERKSIATTPGDIVSFDPSASVFYPGAVLQETGMREGLGSLKLVPGLENKRAPIKIVLSTGGQTTVADPDYGNVATVVGELRSGLNNKPMATLAHLYYSTASDSTSSALHLGISAKYLTASAKAVLDTKHSLNQESINGVLVVRAYTISAQPLAPGWRGFLGDKFTLDDAKALGSSGAISRGNQPCYVDSVTYGTIVVFNMTRTLTEAEIKAKMEAKLSVGVASGSEEASAEIMKQSKDTTVSFTTIGGGYGNVSNAIKTIGAEEFKKTMDALTSNAPASTELAPISYTIRALKDRSLAAVQSTTDYTITTAAPNPIGEKLKLHVSFKITDADDGYNFLVPDNTVECWSTVRINDTKVGGLERSKAADEEKNQTLDLAEIPYEVYYGKDGKDGSNSVKFNIDVIDRDKVLGDDDNLGSFNFTLDPTKQVEKGTYFMKGGCAELRIVFVREGYL